MKETTIKKMLLSAKEVSSQFFGGKISYQKVLAMTRKGLIPCMAIGNIYYYSPEALEEWFSKSTSTPAWVAVKGGIKRCQDQ